MDYKDSVVSLSDEQYFVLPAYESAQGVQSRQVAPVSFFQIKSELARLSLYIEDLIAKETAAIIDLEAGLESIRSEIENLKVQITGKTTADTNRVIGVVDEKIEDIASRIVSRQDAVNARTAKLANDLQVFESVLEGKIEGVKGVVSSTSSDIAKSVHESIVTTQASLQADISSELTDLGRLILKKVKESLESDGTRINYLTGISEELDKRLCGIEITIIEKLKQIEKLKASGESSTGCGDGRTTIDKAEIRELLAIMDSFDRLLQFLERKGMQVEESVLSGVVGIRALIERYLTKLDLNKLAVEGKFDPNLHRAMAVVEVPDKEDGDIVEVLLSGYLYKGKVLRSAEVIINRCKS